MQPNGARAQALPLNLGSSAGAAPNTALPPSLFPLRRDKLPAGGYPDMGSGRYSALLPYADWLSFNNAQRAHQNYIEGATSAVTLALVSGLKSPLPTAGAVVACK